MKEGNAISENLFPPELVIKSAEQIGLDAAQTAALRTAMQEARPKLAEAQQKLAADNAALAELLRAVPTDSAKCLAQLDKVLEDEKAVKQITLSLMLEVRGKLTSEQIAKLKGLRDVPRDVGAGKVGGEGIKVGGGDGVKAGGGDGGVKIGGDKPRDPAAGGVKVGGEGAVPEELRAKMQSVRMQAQSKQAAGGDITAVKALATEAQSLAQQGRYREASAKLDEALNLLRP
jgi:hypothetical protein